MKIEVVDSSQARSAGRLDARHLIGTALSRHDPPRPGQTLLERSTAIWQPSRFRRIYAAAAEEGVPYLRPYDIFDYVPRPADILSRSRSLNLDQLMVKPGTILQTCSGRNLGPAILVDSYLAKFAFSHDLVRIQIDDLRTRLAALAYLRTAAGRRAMISDKAGSVIDHLTPDQVSRVHIPDFAAPAADVAARLIDRATRLRALARTRLVNLQTRVEASVPVEWASRGLDYSASSLDVTGRLDAAFYSPVGRRVREALVGIGSPRMVDLAEVRKPGGRYSPRYVAPGHGDPLMSGRQILQWHPINLKHVALISFRDPDLYRIAAATILYQADGRAEEGLGKPAVVTQERDGWLASGHVGRLSARSGIPWGSLYLGLATRHCQVQIRAASSGSVVDSTFVSDMEAVVVPAISRAMAASAERAWAAMAAADRFEARATQVVEEAFVE